jgi:hypothetical protein
MPPRTRAQVALDDETEAHDDRSAPADQEIEDPIVPEVQNSPLSEGANLPDDPLDGISRESKIFLETLSQALAKAITDSVATARQQSAAAPNPAKYLKAKDPGMFNGRKRRYLRT